jgi:hypothetical protein
LGQTYRIIGMILIMWYQITGFITASIFSWLLCGLFFRQFSYRIVLHWNSRVVTSQDFIKFGGNFFAFVLLELIEISQGFKNFWVIKSSTLQTNSNSLSFLEEFLWERPIAKYLFFFFIKTYASLLAME